MSGERALAGIFRLFARKRGFQHFSVMIVGVRGYWCLVLRDSLESQVYIDFDCEIGFFAIPS